jgi:hypothetical protein
MKLAFSRQISEKYSDIAFHAVEAVLFHVEGITNMTLIFAFRNYTSANNIKCFYCIRAVFVFIH